VGDEYSIVITKLGRIDGAIVMPPAGIKLDITPEVSRLVREGWDIINRGSEPPSPFMERKPKPVVEQPPVTKPPAEVEPVAETAPELEPAPAVEAPTQKIYSCRKCDFTTPDKYKLIGHYSSVHSWWHEEQIIKEEPIVSKEFTESTLKPDGWDKMSLKQRQVWYDEQKQGIVTDLATMGSYETRKKWGITNSTLDGLLRRWEEPPLPKRERRGPSSTPIRSKRYGKSRPLAYWEENREKLIADYNSMTVVDFFRSWHISTVAWVKIRDLLKIPKKSLALGKEDQTINKKVQELLPIPMPLFPSFDPSWCVPVQEEWLKAYAEIVKAVYPGNKQ